PTLHSHALSYLILFFLLLLPLPPRSTLFPYTTLFRSGLARGGQLQRRLPVLGRGARPGLGEPAQRRPGLLDLHLRRRWAGSPSRSEEHTSELQSLAYLVCRLLLEKKKKKI